MTRHLIHLVIALLAVAGVVTPACASAARMKDCCPPGHPCPSQQHTPRPLAPRSEACCDTPAPVISAVIGHALKDWIDDSPAPGGAADSADVWAMPPPVSSVAISLIAELAPSDRQLIYLLTGRLRL